MGRDSFFEWDSAQGESPRDDLPDERRPTRNGRFHPCKSKAYWIRADDMIQDNFHQEFHKSLATTVELGKRGVVSLTEPSPL
jgi:hypothetical protein